MPHILLPFDNKNSQCKDSASNCSLIQSLPQQLQEVGKKQPFLFEYLHLVPIDKIGIPQYYDTLDRSLSSISVPNLIYPTKGGTFSHIIHDPDDGRNTFIPIEPILNRNMDSLVLDVEKKLLAMSSRLTEIASLNADDKKAAFIKILNEIFSNGSNPTNSSKPKARNSPPVRGGKWRKWPFAEKKVEGLQVTPQQAQCLKYLLIRDKLGLGLLDPLVNDTYVEDISCSGMGFIFLEHKIFKSLKTVINFATHDELDTFVMRLAERIKKPVTVHNPICDATLPDGSRINIVYGQDISKRGSNFTIRRFSETPMSVLDLIEMGSMDYTLAAYLATMLGEGMNLFVCGETASGKTTTLNAITTFIHPNAKIVSIEDTPELQVPHKNWIREVVSSGEEGSGVTMFELLKAALRQRPNEIIIGEIRGAEGAIAFQAMQTGHSVMATFHAASIDRLLQRMTGNPINVPKTYMDNLNLALIQSAVKLPSGKPGRRILSISEIVSYDSLTQSFSYVEVFRWDPYEDKYVFCGAGNSYLMEYKIAPKLGIPGNEKKRIYGLIERKARILEKIHKSGVKDFYELLNILAKAQKEGIF